MSWFVFHSVAEFGLNFTSVEVNEEEGVVLNCVELLSGNLDRNISLDLEVTLETATSEDLSGNETTLEYTFVRGSGPGAVECASLGISSDGIVERVEELSVRLSANPTQEDVVITQPNATVFISDSPFDSKCSGILGSCGRGIGAWVLRKRRQSRRMSLYSHCCSGVCGVHSGGVCRVGE
jgi:hypothetical protein